VTSLLKILRVQTFTYGVQALVKFTVLTFITGKWQILTASSWSWIWDLWH